MKPIFKIKRGSGVPSGLTAAELAVDLQSNKLYIGDSLGNSIPIGTEVDTILGTSNNKIVTQKTVKTQVDLAAPSPSSSYVDKKVLFLTVAANLTNSSVVLQNIEFTSVFVQLNTFSGNLLDSSGELQIDDPTFFGYGIMQTSKTQMYLNVNYSMIYSPTSTTVNDVSGQFWRLSGMRVIDVNNTTDVTYYGVKVTPPMIGTGIQTFMNGSAIIKLPKSTYNPGTGLGKRYVLQFVYQIFSNFSAHQIGNPNINSTAGVMPAIDTNYGIKIDISKVGEVA